MENNKELDIEKLKKKILNSNLEKLYSELKKLDLLDLLNDYLKDINNINNIDDKIDYVEQRIDNCKTVIKYESILKQDIIKDKKKIVIKEDNKEEVKEEVINIPLIKKYKKKNGEIVYYKYDQKKYNDKFYDKMKDIDYDNIKFNCECGKKIFKNNLKNHLISRYHINFINNKNI